MTKKFRPNQCPTCQYNSGNYACRYSVCEAYSGEPAGTIHIDWTNFEGRTNRKCGYYEPKRELEEKNAK